MSYKIFKPEEINLDNIVYHKSKKLENSDGKEYVNIPISYNNNNTNIPLIFQIPSIQLNDSYIKKNSSALLIPIKTINENKTTGLKSFLNDLDEKIISDFKTNGRKWCKNYIDNLVNIEYKALVNDIDDDDIIYDNGVLSLELDTNATSKIKIYDENKQFVSNNEIENCLVKGNIIQCILELKSIAIVTQDDSNEIFSCIKTHQIRFKKPEDQESDSDSIEVPDVDIVDYSFLESEIEPNIINNMNPNIENNKNIADDSDSDTSSDSFASSASSNDFSKKFFRKS